MPEMGENDDERHCDIDRRESQKGFHDDLTSLANAGIGPNRTTNASSCALRLDVSMTVRRGVPAGRFNIFSIILIISSSLT